MTVASEIEEQFWALCSAADLADDEASLVAVLDFVKAHPEQRDVFANFFIQMDEGQPLFTDWILLFCMRELRYPEVCDAVNARFNRLGGPLGAARLMNYVSDVNHAYNDPVWEHVEMFSYHWTREHPGQAWPRSSST